MDHTQSTGPPQDQPRPREDGESGRSRRAWSLRSHFLVFGLALVFPLAMLSTFLIVESSATQRAQMEQRVVENARQVAAEIDRELQRRVSVLQTLAYSPALSRGDFATFHAHALNALGDERTVITLSRPPAFQQVVNTFRPFGSELPSYGSPETARRAVETKTWQISDFFIGRVSGRPAFDIVLPILKHGEVEYVLTMGLEPPLLMEILKGPKLPAGWVLNVADRKGVILARTSGTARVGAKLPPEFAEQRDETVLAGRSLEGTDVLRATARSRLAGWQIAVNIPIAAAEGPLRRNIGLILLWTIAALLFSALLAAFFARRLAHPITTAAEAAACLAEGRAVPPIPSRIAEANRLADALHGAAVKIAATEEKQRRAYEELAEQKVHTEVLFRQQETIFQANPSGMLVVDRDGSMVFMNHRLATKFGYTREELLGRPVEILVPPRYRPQHAAHRAGYFGLPTPRPMGAGRELYGLRKDGSEFPIEIGLSPFRSEGRDMALAIVVDITERRRLAEREKMLTDELQHRTRNLFSVVQAVANRTLRGDKRMEEARDDFLGRMVALARADRMLMKSAAAGTSLKDIIMSELAPFAASVKLTGPEVLLSAQRAQNFALAIHELSTNAAKYGALSKPGGTVGIDWSLVNKADGDVLTFRWRERGGPAPTAPAKQGFGTTLLRFALGNGRVDYGSEGLNYEIDVALGTSGIITHERSL